MASDAQIDVSPEGDGFRVIVRDSSSSTEHVVDVPEDYVSQLELEGCDLEKLVGESFRFLLEREPKESIMRKFEISVIERYFPEYPDEIRLRMGWASR
jgi:hypothetical protein